MNEREIYLKFLKLSHHAEGNQKLCPSDSISEKLLELIALADEQREPLTVTQAIRFIHLASPSTLHRKLGELMQSGHIVQAFLGTNRRTRYLRLTEKSQTYFSCMGAFLARSVLEAA